MYHQRLIFIFIFLPESYHIMSPSSSAASDTFLVCKDQAKTWKTLRKHHAAYTQQKRHAHAQSASQRVAAARRPNRAPVLSMLLGPSSSAPPATAPFSVRKRSVNLAHLAASCANIFFFFILIFSAPPISFSSFLRFAIFTVCLCCIHTNSNLTK